MRGTSSCFTFVLAMLVTSSCGTGDTEIDPGDLELRDLLGIDPEVAQGWDADQRAAARRVLVAGLGGRTEAIPIGTVGAATIDERLARALKALDRDRAASGAGALGVVRIENATTAVASPAPTAASVATTGGAAPAAELWLGERWSSEQGWGHLPGRGLDVLSAIAIDAGHTDGPVVVAPAPRLSVIAVYSDAEPPRLVVNPVLLAALEPDAFELDTVATLEREPAAPASAPSGARIADRPPEDRLPPIATVAHGDGNPYSFYGSVAECAFAQRARCEGCAGTGTCDPVTDIEDGDAECAMLDANSGRGYYLLCINLALAIASVDQCTADGAPACARDNDAASELSELENNANFLDDATCGGALDGCLDEIYGAPPEDFPGPDGGVTPPRPPRSTSVDCGDSCDDSNNNCEASPSADCSGPSCNNSFSCDSACSSSNDQSGCGGNCEGCSSDDGGGGGGGGGGCSSDSEGGSSGGGCGGDGDGGGDSGGGCGGDSGGDSGGGCSGDSGGGCGGDSGGGCGGDSGGGCGGDSGGGCGGDSGGGCGGDSGGGCGDSGGGGGCSGGGGGGGGGSCNVTRRDPSAGAALAISLVWAFLPVPVAMVVRRRARKKRARDAEDSLEGAPPVTPEAASAEEEAP